MIKYKPKLKLAPEPAWIEVTKILQLMKETNETYTVQVERIKHSRLYRVRDGNTRTLAMKQLGKRKILVHDFDTGRTFKIKISLLRSSSGEKF